MWGFGKSAPINIATSVLFNLGNSMSLKLGKLDLILLSILWYLTFKFGTTNALSIAIFSGCELDDTLNETIFDWTLEELRRAFPISNVLDSPCSFSMWATSSRISVASEPASRSAFVWTIFVPFVMVTGKICRNVLLNSKWLELNASFGLLCCAWCTGSGELVASGGVMLSLCSNVWWRLLQLATLHLCFDWQFFMLWAVEQFQQSLFALTNSFLAFIELGMKSSQVGFLCFLEQNRHFTSSFSLICPLYLFFFPDMSCVYGF